MAFLDWDDALNLGIESIDEQHRGLVGLVNELHAALTSGAAVCPAESLVESLKTYAVEHFGTEESYMLAAQSPELPVHRAEHEAFKIAVAHYEDGCARGEDTPERMLAFLKTWLAEHIAGMDQRMAASLGPALRKS